MLRLFASVCVILVILATSCTCNNFSYFLDVMDDTTIQTVGILLSAYNNLHSPEKAWSVCEYCTNCPNFEDLSGATNFISCPLEMNILSEKVKNEYNYHKIVSDRYISEFIGFSATQVHTRRRVHTRNGAMEPFTREKVHLNEMNVTMSKVKLDVVDLDTVLAIPIHMNEDLIGEEKTWQMLAYETPTKGSAFLHGKVSYDGWEGIGTETSGIWPIRKNVSRRVAFSYMWEVEELRLIGCACIRSHIGNSSHGTPEEVVEKCRTLIEVEREEVRPIVQLSGCLSEEEKLEMRRQIFFNEERHTEL